MRRRGCRGRVSDGGAIAISRAGLSRAGMVAHAHEILALLQRDTVVRVVVARSVDVIQPKGMPELMQDRALEIADTVPDAANAGLSGVPIEREVAVGEQPQSLRRRGERAEGRLPGLDDKVPLIRMPGRIDQPEGKAARDPGGRGGSLCTARLIPRPVRRELELAVPVAHDDADEIFAKSDPLRICPRVEMIASVVIVQDAITGAVGAHDIEVRGRFTPHELQTVLEHEIDGSIVHRHEERVTIPAIVNHMDLHGRVLIRLTGQHRRAGCSRQSVAVPYATPITRQSRLPVQRVLGRPGALSAVTVGYSTRWGDMTIIAAASATENTMHVAMTDNRMNRRRALQLAVGGVLAGASLP